MGYLARRNIISPVVSGVEHLSDPLSAKRPILFVGNHTLFGVYDLPFLIQYTGSPSLVPIPKPERLYFRFLPAIDTAHELQNVGDAAQCMAVYAGVKARVLAGIAQLQAEREADPERHLARRLLAQAKCMMPAFDLMKDVIH
ncbi:hypothetical protein WJX72_008639 [[Myrmecia] bisecta]|uniref:Acyltransferase n=1 Tax=[Myrmecia] bisecta TaxID=41462 RepID=A0AAW1R8P8_9CHLO